MPADVLARSGVREPVAFAGEVRARVAPGHNSEGVLWIHGYTVDSTIWTDLWSLLPGWSHYGIDLPGHGKSPALQPGSTLRELGHQIAIAAVEHRIRHILGLSLGSMIALQVVLSRPGAFDTLILAAPALAGGPVEWEVGIRYRELRELYQRRGAGPWMTELWMRSPPATFAHASPALRTRLAAVINRHTWSELGDAELGVAGLARQSQDARALVNSTARPLIITGEYELPAFKQTADILRAIRPDAQLVELSSAGHLCILHAPRQAARLLAKHWRPDIKRRSTSG